MGWVDVTEPYAAPPQLPDELSSGDVDAHPGAPHVLSLERCCVERRDLSRRRITELRQCHMVEEPAP